MSGKRERCGGERERERERRGEMRERRRDVSVERGREIARAKAGKFLVSVLFSRARRETANENKKT